MNVAVDQRRTVLAQVRRQGSVCAMLVGALLAGTAQTQAQEPGSAKPGAAAPAQGAPASKKAAPANGAPAAAKGDAKSQASYSIGVSMGEQLHATGLTPESVSVERLAQGIRDALAGKVKMTDADQQNIASVIRAARTSLAETNHNAAAAFLAENGKKKDVVTTASGLQYKVITPGSGASPSASDEVSVNYKGSLLDGTVFDASENHGGPATFPVGGLIPGWTEALLLMKPGAKWQLFVPPKLAYDERPPGPPIPPGALLVFDVELVSIKPHTAAPHPVGPPITQPPATK
jgi:FKBP-type peptidyl-prolyl cis-trans isomerase FklB